MALEAHGDQLIGEERVTVVRYQLSLALITLPVFIILV